ncbi:MAG: tetratricopeptide repeat protein [Candidatus Methylomirabilales bacterium]
MKLGVPPRGHLIAAIVLAAVAWVTLAAWADQKDDRLNALFDRLKTSKSETEAAALTHRIWIIWRQSENDLVNALMAKGVEEISRRNYEIALATFSKVVELEPELAEGWNKRATVYYLMGEYEESVRDIERTLDLEPRHFGALSGLGFIYLTLGDDWGALKAFEAALEINPYLPGARIRAEELRQRQRRKAI